MDLRFFGVCFVVISALLGSQVIGWGTEWSIWVRGLLGALGGSVLVLIEGAMHRFGRLSVRGFSAAVFGLLFGLIMAKLVADAVGLIPFEPGTIATTRVIVTWLFCYLGMALALRGRDEFHIVIPYVRLNRQDRVEQSHVVDTSAVIDGRLLDLCKNRFIEGRLILPRFILKELQTVADSQDPMKRNRGRRGLEVLNQLRHLSTIDVRVHEEDVLGVAEADAKLVKLSKLLDTRLVTTDYNLQKVAELQGVAVLNVNELAQALRPVVIPGEVLEVRPLKEGKESHQAIAYLDDGTMVVVEHGRSLIGKTVRGVVTSILQTAAGRMVFVRPEEISPK